MVLVVSFVGCHFAAPTCPNALALPKDGWPNGDEAEVCLKRPALGCWPKPAVGAAAPKGDVVGAPNTGAPAAAPNMGAAAPNAGAKGPNAVAEASNAGAPNAGVPDVGAPNAGALPNEGAEAPKEGAEPLKGAGICVPNEGAEPPNAGAPNAGTGALNAGLPNGNAEGAPREGPAAPNAPN